jgi:GxxExxY protein
MSPDELNALSKQTLDAAFRVHTALGPGLLESAYTACLVYELRKAGLEVKVEVPVPIVYDRVKLADVGYRIDILVAGELVIEVKSLEAIAPVHLSQLISYLKLADRRLGLLLNFNVESFRDGIYRRVNRL